MAPVTELMLGCQTFVKNFTWQKMVIIDGKMVENILNIVRANLSSDFWKL